MKGTFTVAGQRVRTDSMRRYVLFLVYRRCDGTEGIVIHKRTDSLRNARSFVRSYGFASTRRLVIVDTTTGETVS